MHKTTHTAAASLMLAFAIGCGAAEASSIDVYANNFDNAATYGSGVTGGLSGVTATATTSAQSLPQPFSGNMLWNSSVGGATTLTLSNLQQHSSITVKFLLGILGSWDGVNSFYYGPDSMNVTLDGKSIFSEIFGASSGTSSYAFPAGTLLATYQSSSQAYKVLDMGADPLFKDIAHTGSTLTLKWFASGPVWQGGTDESFSLDNIEVSLNGTASVPEPAAAGLLAVGLMGLGLGTAARRRRQA